MDKMQNSQMIGLTVLRLVFYGTLTWLLIFKSWGNELFNYIDKFVWLVLIAVEPARAIFRRQRQNEELMEKTYEKIDENLGDSSSKIFQRDDKK
jgi:hypothetical protein